MDQKTIIVLTIFFIAVLSFVMLYMAVVQGKIPDWVAMFGSALIGRFNPFG